MTPPIEPAPGPPPAPPRQDEVLVEYRGSAPRLALRAASGRLYTFSAARRSRAVRAVDAAQLLTDPDLGTVNGRTDESSKEGSDGQEVARTP